MKKFKVARVIARLNIGGPAIHVTLLTAKQDPARFKSWLIAGSIGQSEGDMGYYAQQHGVIPIVIPELGRSISPFADLSVLIKLWRTFRRLRPDIVHTHTAKAGTVGRLAARLARVPVVLHTFHGHVFHGYFNPAVSKVFQLIERVMARISDRIIVLSPKLRDELLRYRIAPVDKIEIIPLGLDLEPLLSLTHEAQPLRDELGIPSDTQLVGIIGRLVPVKNHKLFLQAARIVRDAGTPAHYLIIGDGELRTELEIMADELGISSRVHFIGWRRDLVPIYAGLDLLTLTSINEGTPVSLIEAMAAGVPIVATKVGGVPDLVQDEHTGWLVEPGDPKAFGKALSHALASDMVRNGLSKRIRKQTVERYGYPQLVQNIEGLYLMLLKQKRVGLADI